MAKRGVIFVLWGERCEETQAVAWVSRLRSEGRRVYLVAVSGRRVRGLFGIPLEPDIGLDEALGLVAQVDLIVIPCGLESLNVFRRDPRFDELLVLAGQNGAHFLAHPSAQETVAGLVPDGGNAEVGNVYANSMLAKRGIEKGEE